MRTLRFLLQKEFRQIFRNKALLPMIFIMPVIQLLILPLAADYEVKNINISIIDRDRSPYSRALIDDVLSSGYFRLAEYSSSYSESLHQIELDEADLVLEIPVNFEKNLTREQAQTLFVAVNAINGTKANLGGAYLGRIVRAFNENIRMSMASPVRYRSSPTVDIVPQNWFNTHLNYAFFMVPGILAVLVTMVGAYMCSLNIVKEKEIGTIEQINVTPIRKHHFILGKLIPFWMIGIFVFSVGLFGVARFVYGIVPQGNLIALYAFLSLYLVALLGLGLLISTYAETQQQAMSIAFFFMMIFLLMSGLFTPIESMPEWARTIALFNPVTYFIEVMRMVVLKGSGFHHLKNHFLIIGAFAIFFNGWAILNYRKTSG